MKGRNIAVFLDGTWNQVDDYTNVYLLYQMCQGVEIGCEPGKQHWKEDPNHEEAPQLRYYDSGVGTGLENLSPVLLGGAIGLGLKRNVAQAYLTICRYYRPGDRIFIFGFSRGAYTARTLGGLLHLFGILKPEYTKPIKTVNLKAFTFFAHRKELKIPGLAVDTIREARKQSQNTEVQKRIIERFKKRYCLNEETEEGTPVEFMGVFDTVGSMGIPSLLDPLGARTSKRKSYLDRNKMPNASFPKNIAHARHALAVDEYRAHFRPTLWTDIGDSDVEQRWFVGAHSNIGGGYPDNLLSNKPLHWMYQHAQSHGLELARFLSPHQDVHLEEPINDSFSSFRWAYSLQGYGEYYRPIAENKEAIKNESIDPSVLERTQYDPVYRTQSVMSLTKEKIKTLNQNTKRFDNELVEKLKSLDKA